MNHMQIQVRDFCVKHSLESSKNARLLDVVSEIGELAKEFLKVTSYGQTDNIVSNEAIVLEFGDVFFSLLALGDSLDIDAQHALDLALAKYAMRINNKNSPAS